MSLFFLAVIGSALGLALGLYFGVVRGHGLDVPKYRHAFVAAFTTSDYGDGIITVPATPAGITATINKKLRVDDNAGGFAYAGAVYHYATTSDSETVPAALTTLRNLWITEQEAAGAVDVRLFISPVVAYNNSETSPLIFPLNGFYLRSDDQLVHASLILARGANLPAGTTTALGISLQPAVTPVRTEAYTGEQTNNDVIAAMDTGAAVQDFELQQSSSTDAKTDTSMFWLSTVVNDPLRLANAGGAAGAVATYDANDTVGPLAITIGAAWGNLETSYSVTDAALRWYTWQAYAMYNTAAVGGIGSLANYIATPATETVVSHATPFFRAGTLPAGLAAAVTGAPQHANLPNNHIVLGWNKPGYFARAGFNGAAGSNDTLDADAAVVYWSTGGDEGADIYPGLRQFEIDEGTTPLAAGAVFWVVNSAHISADATNSGLAFDLSEAVTSNNTVAVANGTTVSGVFDAAAPVGFAVVEAPQIALTF